MAALPLSVLISVAGLIRDRKKGYAVAGLVIGGLTCCMWGILTLCR